MLDPQEQKKGGFRAFVQRDNERRDAEALKNTTSNGAAPGTPDTPPSTDSTTRSDASRGTPSAP